jgi:hypothetical protein
MNRVLNKGFASKSYKNSTLIAFSDVFHPASCMQSWYLSTDKRAGYSALLNTYTPDTSCTSKEQENLMRSCNAC